MYYRPFSGTRVVVALMLREMASTYGRAPGGYLWVLLEPLAGIALMTVVFSYAFRTPPLGSNFALFYASGFLPFMAYTQLTAKMGGAIRYSRPLLAYPSVTYFDALLSRFLLGFITKLLLFILVIWGIHIVYGLEPALDFGRLLNAFGMIAVLSFGFGVVNCYLFGAFPIWEQIWSILNRPLFIMSGLFFLINSVGEQARSLLLWNPVAHIICEMRAGIFPIYDAQYASPFYVYSVGTVSTFFGLLMLYRHHRFLITEGA